ncbi:hypothetical protein ACSS7Z_03575 [Microbacterium sp. A82]|uniref:hypothetical protein n=1 Tax=Microbacterium sp. A82 TaxID=3450452 RepID=UPI003F400B03
MTKNDSDYDRRFAAALSEAIIARDVSLTWLHRHLHDRATPVSMATLSYWRSGDRHPEGTTSRAAVDEIEALLGLSPGSLSELIQPIARVGALPAAYVPSAAEISAAIEEITKVLGTTPSSGLRDLSTLTTVEVGSNGAVESVTMRALVQSTMPSMTSVPLFDFVPEPGVEPKKIVNVIGGTLAPPYVHPGGKVVCDVLTLDRPVPAGGTTMIEFTELYAPGYPQTRQASHAVSRPARQTAIWVRFHPDAVADWCEEFVDAGEGEAVRSLEVAGTSVHVFRFGFGPATLGVRWGFDD